MVFYGPRTLILSVKKHLCKPYFYKCSIMKTDFHERLSNLRKIYWKIYLYQIKYTEDIICPISCMVSEFLNGIIVRYQILVKSYTFVHFLYIFRLIPTWIFFSPAYDTHEEIKDIYFLIRTSNGWDFIAKNIKILSSYLCFGSFYHSASNSQPIEVQSYQIRY